MYTMLCMLQRVSPVSPPAFIQPGVVCRSHKQHCQLLSEMRPGSMARSSSA